MRDYFTEMTDAELEIEKRIKAESRWWNYIEGVLATVVMTILLILPVFV